MESLVDYEDSDSDGEPSHTPGCGRRLEPNQDITVSLSSGPKPSESHAKNIDSNWTLSGHDRSASLQTGRGAAVIERQGPPPLPQSHTGWERRFTPPPYPDTSLLNNYSRVACTASIASPDTPEKTSRQQTSSGPPPVHRRTPSDTVKRPQSVPSGIRPYVSKRQRLSEQTSAAQHASPEASPTVGEVSTKQARCVQMLSEVCERVKPYLLDKPSGAGFPRRPLRSLEGHAGPVNTVHWCPVPQLSHLLLSASMDKTVKVMRANRTSTTSRLC